MQLDQLRLCTVGRNVLHKRYGPVREKEEQDIIKNCTSFIGHGLSQEQLQQQGCDGQGSYRESEILTHPKDHQEHTESIHHCYHNVKMESPYFHTNLLVG
jgi:hypothetical protein